MKLSEVKEKVLKGELVIENDIPKSEKTIKVLNYIDEDGWVGLAQKYALCHNFLGTYIDNELIDVPHIKVSEIDLEEEVTYTREQAIKVIEDYALFFGIDINTIRKGSLRDFINYKFPPSEEKTLEELKTYYEEKEGKKVIIKKD